MTIKKSATTIGRKLGRMMSTLEKSTQKPAAEITKALRRSAKELVKLADQLEKKEQGREKEEVAVN